MSTSASTSSMSSSPRWNSARCHQLCTAKKLPSLQVGERVPSQATPSRRRSCISITWATACQAQPSRCSSSTRVAPAPRRARSRRSPPGRTRACRAPRGSPACRAASALSARAMRSRSMREWPVKKSTWWPACSASSVQRIGDAQVLEHAAGRGASGRATRCVGGAAGARARAPSAGSARGGVQRVARRLQAGRLGAEQVQVGHQQVGHRHVGAVAQRACCARPSGSPMKQRSSCAGVLVVVERSGAGAADGVAEAVVDRHDGLAPLWNGRLGLQAKSDVGWLESVAPSDVTKSARSLAKRCGCSQCRAWPTCSYASRRALGSALRSRS